MQYILLLFVMGVCANISFAQKEASIWYMGFGNGIDFSKSPPEIAGTAPDGFGVYSTISDPDGKLIFYCDNTTVWNSQHQVLQNGTGLGGALFEESIILKKPGSNNEYYVFQVGLTDEESYNLKVIYSVVDMDANDGAGRVGEKNVLLYTNLHGSITVSGDCESGYWLVGEADTNVQQGSDKIYAFRINEEIISPTPVISEPVEIGNSGNFRFSPDGERIIFSYGSNLPPHKYETIVALFDKESGAVSNPVKIGPCCGQGEFSPDGKLLYVTYWSSSGVTLRQYDLTQPDFPSIELAVLPNLYSPQLAPDGKIYFLTGNDREMAVVEYPEIKGLGCNFTVGEIFPFSNLATVQLLPMPASHLLYKNPDKINAGPDVEICSGVPVQIGGSNNPSKEYEWFPKDHLDNPHSSNPTFKFENHSDSTVEFTYRIKSCDEDLVKITVHPIPQPEIVGSRSVCPGVEKVDYFTPSKEGYGYNWAVEGGILAEGQGTERIQVNWGSANPDAVVRLIVTNQFNCASDETSFPVSVNVELQTEMPKGLTEVCDNKRLANQYEILPTNGSVYTWEVNGGEITGGQGSSEVQVDWMDQDGQWIRVLEKSVTIDTVCFGVSPPLDVTVFEDSLQLILNYLTFQLEDDSQLEIAGELGNTMDASLFPVNIYRKRSEGLDWQLRVQAGFHDSISQLDTDLASDEDIYMYYIQTINGCDQEVVSDIHNTIKLSASVDTDTQQPLLSWNPYLGWPEGVKSYELYRKLDSQDEFTLVGSTTGSRTSFSVEGLKDGFAHSFVVKAIAGNNQFYSLSNQITLSFDHLLFIPNIFTPNGDGVNDSFMMDPIHLFGENELTVFNRWGNEVYRKKNYSGDWAAAGIEDGVYYYRLFVEKGQREFVGWVQIMR